MTATPRPLRDFWMTYLTERQESDETAMKFTRDTFTSDRRHAKTNHKNGEPQALSMETLMETQRDLEDKDEVAEDSWNAKWAGAQEKA